MADGRVNLELAREMASDMRRGYAPKGSGVALVTALKPMGARRAWDLAGELIESLVTEVEQARCVGVVANARRTLDEALQAAADEVAALRLMSYTGGQADLREEDVAEIRALLADLAVLLARATGSPLPEGHVIL